MTTKKKNPAAVALGRLGGSTPTNKPKGFAALSKRRRMEIVRMGNERNRELARQRKANKEAAK